MPAKIDRSAFLYLDPVTPHSIFAQCETCNMFIKPDKCSVVSGIIAATGSCNFYLHGDPMPDMHQMNSVTQEESGYEDRKVRCENCYYFDDKESYCELYKLLNQQNPDLYDLDEIVHPKGCCNANTAIGPNDETYETEKEGDEKIDEISPDDGGTRRSDSDEGEEEASPNDASRNRLSRQSPSTLADRVSENQKDDGANEMNGRKSESETQGDSKANDGKSFHFIKTEKFAESLDDGRPIIRIYLVRHGQTKLNEEGKLRGWLDVPLSPKGIATAKAVANFFASKNISLSKVYSSDLQRAEDTASLIDPNVIPQFGFRPMQLGGLQGKSHEEVDPVLLDLVQEWKDNPDYRYDDDSDSFREFFLRATSTLLETVQSHKFGDTIVIVTHLRNLVLFISWIIASAPKDVKDYDIESMHTVTVEEGSVSEVIWDGTRFQMVMSNEIDHLKQSTETNA